MSKLYYPSPDEVQGATPLNGLVWFERYQHLLVKLANTDWGRDLLLIDKHPYPVVAIGKNYVRFHLGVWDDQDHYMSDFRIGAKWSNIIRYRWLEVKKALDRTFLESILSYPPVYYRGRVLHPVGGGAEHNIFYPNPDDESSPTTCDGRVLASAGHGNANWASIRANLGPEPLADTAATAALMRGRGANTLNTYIELSRSFLLFDTSDIDAGDIISSATFSLCIVNKLEAWTESVSMVTSNPTSPTALGTGDYQRIGVAIQAPNVTIASMTANDSAYTDWTLSSIGLGNIAQGSGVSKFGARLTLDLSDTPTPSWVNNGSTGINWNTADQTGGTSKDPKLTVIHGPPFTPRVIMF